MKSLQEFWKWLKHKLGKDKPTLKIADETDTQWKEPPTKSKDTIINDTEYHAIKRRKEKFHIWVGLDFGTSTTKMVHSPVGGKGKVSPILFNHDLPHYPSYCLPSLAAFDNTGRLLLGSEAARFLAKKPWDSGLRRFKVIVAGEYDQFFYDQVSTHLYKKYLAQISLNYSDCKPEFLTAVFLAFAMRQARNEIRRKFSGCEMDIEFNTCIPIDHIQKNNVRLIFEQILATADAIEKEWTNDGDCNKLLDLAKEKYKKAQYSPKNPNTRMFGVPEAVAEIASYLVSTQKRDGLHAVIDFGAGTTDVSIFNLENVGMRGAVKKLWYAARNLPRGAQRIERIVSLYLEHTSKEQNVTDSHVVQAVSKINKLPDELKYKIKQELKELWEESHAVWGQAYSHRRSQSEWEKDKVHVLVCGGGANAPYIKDIFSKSWMKGWGPYPVYPFPIPDDYDTMDDKVPFERMSVAYGLCQPLPSLGDYTLPNDSPDQTPPRLHIREMPSWDDRRPRPGWVN